MTTVIIPDITCDNCLGERLPGLEHCADCGGTGRSVTKMLAYLAGLRANKYIVTRTSGTENHAHTDELKYPTLRVEHPSCTNQGCEAPPKLGLCNGLGYTLVDPEVAAMRLLSALGFTSWELMPQQDASGHISWIADNHPFDSESEGMASHGYTLPAAIVAAVYDMEMAG